VSMYPEDWFGAECGVCNAQVLSPADTSTECSHLYRMTIEPQLLPIGIPQCTSTTVRSLDTVLAAQLAAVCNMHPETLGATRAAYFGVPLWCLLDLISLEQSSQTSDLWGKLTKCAAIGATAGDCRSTSDHDAATPEVTNTSTLARATRLVSAFDKDGHATFVEALNSLLLHMQKGRSGRQISVHSQPFQVGAGFC
jgi:hypothetical protein